MLSDAVKENVIRMLSSQKFRYSFKMEKSNNVTNGKEQSTNCKILTEIGNNVTMYNIRFETRKHFAKIELI